MVTNFSERVGCQKELNMFSTHLKEVLFLYSNPNLFLYEKILMQI